MLPASRPHALAHGNVWTLPKRDEEQTLKYLIFLSVKDTIPCEGFADGTKVKFSCVRVTPEAFKVFLE
jgi:hypothetical protein